MKAVTILSGGMDSVTLLHHLNSTKIDQIALHVDYGQRHKKEVVFAREHCAQLNIPLVEIPLHLPFNSVALMGNGDIPDGHYAEESMKKTIVPNRNALMLSLAWGLAVNTESHYVAYAAHTGDHFIYPDCRPEFVKALNEAFQLGSGTRAISIITPFIEDDKTEVVRVGAELGVDFARTWSCYKGRALHCGKCGTCNERIEAFQLAGIEDPTFYEQE